MSNKLRTMLWAVALLVLAPVMISGCDGGSGTKTKDERVMDVFALALVGAGLALSRRRGRIGAPAPATI